MKIVDLNTCRWDQLHEPHAKSFRFAWVSDDIAGARFDYTYTALGNVESIDEQTQVRNFAYDALQRLTAGGTAGMPESYTYDADGNRVASHLSVSHTTDIADCECGALSSQAYAAQLQGLNASGCMIEFLQSGRNETCKARRTTNPPP